MPGRIAWSRSAAWRWLPRALGLLIALELGLLAPLTCVFHCFLAARGERPAIAWFLCGAHHPPAATIADADAPAAGSPRAFFELLPPAPPLLPLAGLLTLIAVLSLARGYVPPFLSPPTPPPRSVFPR
ncbi:MAG: hypothetical protein RMK84_07150 [Oscillochloridaceae bacterium]|nr:hypothetical protein [Chloroflexaceae bacterium]MDW8389886.1 hypothetical protein [Oscillochloridaceae bacterium]